MSTSTTDKKPAEPENEWTSHNFWLGVTHEQVLQCLSEDADPNALVTRYDETVLNTAIRYAPLTSVLALIAAGADVNGLAGHRSPLYLAACHRRGNPEIVQALLDACANIHGANEQGAGPLHAAAASGPGSAETLGILIKADANVHACTEAGKVTALHLAAREGSAEDVAVLLKAGANPHAGDFMGRTPLHWAWRYAPGVITELLAAGAGIDAPDDAGMTPLHDAVYRSSLAATTALLSEGANLEAQTTAGHTPLHIAAQRGDIKLTQFLLDHGAKIDAIDKYGHTPLDLAEGLALNSSAIDVLHRAKASSVAREGQRR